MQEAASHTTTKLHYLNRNFRHLRDTRKILYSMERNTHLLPPPYETLEPVFVNAGFLELGPGSGDSALRLLDALGFSSSSSDSDVSPGESASPSLYLQH